MAQTTGKIPLNMILIGKTGHGKSGTGNSILGRKVFKSSSYANSETKVVMNACAEHDPYEVKVVDGPGLEDTDLKATENKEQACTNMAKALMMCNGGLDAFVLVIKFGTRFTKEERTTISDLQQIFGASYLRNHGIIVITGGDTFAGQMEADETPGKTFNQWCHEQDKDFGNLIEECSPRVVLFNNISKSEEEKTRQRDQLLLHAGQLSKEKGLYTAEHFKAYAHMRDKLIKDSKNKISEETIQREFRTSTSCTMAQTTGKISLNIILIGKTGHGKSATGNSILGRKHFKTSSFANSETKFVMDAWAEQGPYEVKVVDGPGLEDTDLNATQNKKQACRNMAKALMMCNGGIHAFVLVIRFGTRFTKEERTTISDLQQIFGENFIRNHGIIVITGGDSFAAQMEEDETPEKTFNQWCHEQEKDFRNLIKECSPRVVLFNNISKSEGEKTRQRDELLLHAGQLRQEKGLYTNEHFKAYAQMRANLITDSHQKILEETTQKRIELLSAQLKQLTIHSSLEDVDKLEARIQDVYTEIGEESLQEKSMQQLTRSLKSLLTTTKEFRSAIRENNRRAIKSRLETMSQHREELDNARHTPWESIHVGIGALILGGAAAAVASGGALASAVVTLGGGLLSFAAKMWKK